MNAKRIRKELELPRGYRLHLGRGSSHALVIDPTGEALRTAGGIPIRVSVSPSDWRTRANERSRIRAAITEQAKRTLAEQRGRVW